MLKIDVGSASSLFLLGRILIPGASKIVGHKGDLLEFSSLNRPFTSYDSATF